MFPSDAAAMDWFEEIRWPAGRVCAHCGSERTRGRCPCQNALLVFRLPQLLFRSRFGTVMESSKIGYRKWAIAFYQILTNLKGVSSVKLHRDLGISQKSAWFLGHRIREAMNGGRPGVLRPGGSRRNLYRW